MNVQETIRNYYRAMNPMVFFVTEETFQIQTGVEHAIDELNADRADDQKVRLVLHDPLVGFHFGRFKVDGVCGPKAALTDLTKVIAPGDKEIGLNDGWEPVRPTDDCVVVLKGWESLMRPRESIAPDVVQALSNILQGNLCAPQWSDYSPEDFEISEIPEHLLDEPNHRVMVRGRRMLVFISKDDHIPSDLTEVRPIHVPLPGRDQFVSIVQRQWDNVYARGEREKKDYTSGVTDPDRFKERVVSSLSGFPLAAGEDALMLSIVENQGFDHNGTLATIERLKAASIARVPGLKYVPQSRIDQDSEVLPGYEPVKEFIDESLDMDLEYAKAHGIRPISGLIIVGPPGTGKSVVSDQVARLMGKPQLVWSMGESQGSLISESEANTRRVIDTANILQAVLTLDDADKAGLSKDRVANDGGVFDRMINILLSEMSRPDCNITWVINGNRVQNIRPELYRDGRIDERFFADLPDDKLRLRILQYHMRKLHFSCDKFRGMTERGSEEALLDLASDGRTSARRTRGWGGAELAGLVQRATRRAAKTQDEELDIEFMLRIALDKTPQSEQKAAKNDYKDMRDMCSDFIRVGVSSAGKSLQASGPIQSQRAADLQ